MYGWDVSYTCCGLTFQLRVYRPSITILSIFVLLNSMDTAFEFDEEGRGMCTEEDYPYEAKKQSTCTKDCDPVADTLVSSFTDVKPGDYYDLKASIALQPTSIAIQADQVCIILYLRTEKNTMFYLS